MGPLLCLDGATSLIFPEFTLSTLVQLLQLLEAMSWQVSPPVVTDSVLLLHTHVASAVVGGTSYTTILNYLCCWSRDRCKSLFFLVAATQHKYIFKKRGKPLHWYPTSAFHFTFCITLNPCTMTTRAQHGTVSLTYYLKDWDHDSLLMTYKYKSCLRCHGYVADCRSGGCWRVILILPFASQSF